MILTAVAIASVVLIGQSVAAPPAPPAPPPPPRRFDTTILPPTPPAGPDRSRRLRPRGNPGLWVTSGDYPSRAMLEEREGVVSMQLGVGPSGRAVICGIRLTSGSQDLDEAACRNIIRRARFEPALDTNGSPQMGVWPIAVRWAIPSDSAEPDLSTAPAQATRATSKPWLDANGRGAVVDPVPQPLPQPLNEPGDLARSEEFRPPPPDRRQAVISAPLSRAWLLRLSVDEQGTVSACAPTVPSVDPAFDALLCRRYADRVRFLPARDDSGRAVASWTYGYWVLPVAQSPRPVP